MAFFCLVLTDLYGVIRGVKLSRLHNIPPKCGQTTKKPVFVLGCSLGFNGLLKEIKDAFFFLAVSGSSIFWVTDQEQAYSHETQNFSSLYILVNSSKEIGRYMINIANVILFWQFFISLMSSLMHYSKILHKSVKSSDR